MALPDLAQYNAGQTLAFGQQGQKQRTIADLGRLASQGDYQGAERAAFAGGETELGLHLKSMNEADHTRLIEDTARFAISADTPEKWAQASAEFARTHPDFTPPPFQGRQALIDQSVPVLQQLQMKQQQAQAAQAQGNADRDFKLKQDQFELAKQPKPAEPYTLSPDQTRFGPDNAVVATGAPSTPKVPTPYTDLGKAKADLQGGLISQEQFDAVAKAGVNQPNPASIANITTMRKDYENQPGTSRYRTAVPILTSMINAVDDNTAMSDLDFVYGMAKIFDPDSVVRESEMGLVIQGQSVPAQIVGLFSKVASGQAVLQPQSRKDLINASLNRVQQYEQQAKGEAESFGGIASRNNINPQDVIRPLEAFPQYGSATGGASVGGSGGSAAPPIAINPQTGEKLMLKNGQWVPFNG